jgi:hypothetical protein
MIVPFLVFTKHITFEEKWDSEIIFNISINFLVYLIIKILEYQKITRNYKESIKFENKFSKFTLNFLLHFAKYCASAKYNLVIVCI